MMAAIHHGDCRALMADMTAESVDSIVTDPPYELGFMGHDWDSTGVAYDIDMWRQALRVLKPGGHLVAFGGARTYHRMASAIENAGFEIRDQIMWIYGQGFPKGGVHDGVGACLKPAHEPIVLARKRFIGALRANIATHCTGGLNIDSCRIGTGEDRTGGGLGGKRMTATLAMGGSWRSPRLSRPTGGRWPANVTHDGSDEVAAGFPVIRNGGANGDAPARAARFFYCAKASKADRDEGLEQPPSRRVGANRHPTVKPEALMRWLVRLATPANGVVLDPFAGSGSTGKAAVLEHRRFVGFELTAEYLPIARARVASALRRIAA